MIYQGIEEHPYFYRIRYFEFNEDSYTYYFEDEIIEENGTYKNTQDSGRRCFFQSFEDVTIEINDIQDEHYFKFQLKSPGLLEESSILKKKDANEIKEFYENRNKIRRHEKSQIFLYIDDYILDIAENLINLAEEDIFLTYEVLIWEYYHYYHSVNPPYDEKSKIFKDASCLKGKEKKETEKYNDELREKISKLSELIDNFVEIIIDNKQLQPSKKYVANAIAWKAIQKKVIEYYAERWLEEYEPRLEISYDKIYENMTGQGNDIIEEKYINEVLLCNEIDMEHSKEILIYFLLSKCDYKELVLYESFENYYKKIQNIKNSIKSTDIKNKLKIKQKRNISKYTINDVDLMTGTEFEEFVCLLFKKMGYSSQVTKQSGDQGIDVIAIRNGNKIGIQAKCYSNTVGNSAVQEAVAGKKYYNCDKILVVTNNYFTPAAIDLACSNNVILWNRDMLKEKIKEFI